jgi:lycopene cyclase domain-containing protein
MNILFYLWNLPYMRWHLIFTVIPSIVLWTGWHSYLSKYWRVFIFVTLCCFLWGLPLDLLSVPISHIYGFHPTQNLGSNFLGLPLEEYFFLLLIPQEATAVILILRKKLYG